MANLWNLEDDDRWTPTALHSVAILDGGTINFVERSRVAALSGEVLLLPSAFNTQAAKWMLFAPAGSSVRVNDAPLDNGIRILADRDAIRVASLPAMYFSTEQLARIELYSGDENVYCPRDKTLISEGDPAVCCPRCGVWHHELEDKGCWTYSGTCALCDQSTDLDAARFRWTPEDL